MLQRRPLAKPLFVLPTSRGCRSPSLHLLCQRMSLDIAVPEPLRTIDLGV
jgi:hypothetical protein